MLWRCASRCLYATALVLFFVTALSGSVAASGSDSADYVLGGANLAGIHVVPPSPTPLWQHTFATDDTATRINVWPQDAASPWAGASICIGNDGTCDVSFEGCNVAYVFYLDQPATEVTVTMFGVFVHANLGVCVATAGVIEVWWN